MWELFERRLEAEHYLGPLVRAQGLINRLIGTSAQTSGAAAEASTASAAAAAGAEAVLCRLADIVLGIPVHAQAVDARLEAQLGQSSVVGDQLGGSSNPDAEYMAIMGIVNELLDLTEHSSADTDETVTLWRQLADDCIARARVLGQPLTLAQALEAGARVKLATGEPEAAIGLLEEEYDQASRVGGKFAADQAILAMSGLAKARRRTSPRR